MLDNLSNPMSEVLHLERLRNYKHSILEAAMTNNRVLSVARYEQNLQTGPAYPSCVRYLSAVQPTRQPYIGDQQVYSRVRIEDFQSRRAVRCLDHRIAGLRQNLRDQHSDRRIIIYDEHHLSISGCINVGRNLRVF